MTAWNPRYVAYSRVNGKTPEEMQASERGMVGFMLWIGGQMVEFRKAHPEAFVGSAIQDHAAFDKFLGAASCSNP